MAARFRSQLVAFDWSKSEPLHGLLCLPGIALPLIIGLHFGYPGTAALMVGGAQCVGFGSYQQPLFHRSGAMLAASVGIAISALVGALCRDSTVALIVTAVVWAMLYALANTISTATAWVGQQCCIFLVISSAAPSSPGTTHDLVYSALLRCAGVFAGAMLQYAILRGIRHVLPAAQTQFSKPDFDPTHFQRAFLLEQLKPHNGAFQFALRMAVTAAVSVAIYRVQTWTSAYWIGMTALLIPKPEFTQTAVRGLLRAAGTLLGAALCTLIVVEARPQGMWLALLVLLFQYVAYLLANVNYGAFALALTGYICFVLAVAHQPPNEVLLHRVLATLAGTAIALGIHAAFVLGRKALHITPPTLHSLEERL
ncbi:hypothetical protein Terro_0371 [Terriglobus roseus DSM 18391]|uniref:Integral membrane bound transporter domain-containing protein n=1 Tax=Terriglobus roseus (strain DSM 18391 / NRRL B-41598 / KBS 63) TaxID=926566 RepID=I3ZBV2_TERRK|nr:FUSC family protein [Terriglobus roseus]AFL86720.1 hypothetical protein Terro_0371 [Terriglobus roseus DSM 18391]